MFNRAELKANGKSKFKANYLMCVIVEFVLGILLAVETKSANSGSEETQGTFDMLGNLSPQLILGAILGVSLVGAIIGILIKIFIKNPLVVGGYRFFLDNSYSSDTSADRLLFVYKQGSFLNIFITMFLRDLFLALWTCLFVIPGIIKSYSYRMVPFILAENPEMNWSEAITRSRRMMDGYKWQAFILDLSFIGWILLALITFNIVGVLYTNPYKRATEAELYRYLKYNS